MTQSFDVRVSNQRSNETAVTTRLMELINNLSESQQQALLTTLVELVEKTEASYLNFLEWKKRVDFQPAYAEVHLVSEKYQFGHYLIECNIKAITPDNIEHTATTAAKGTLQEKLPYVRGLCYSGPCIQRLHREHKC